MRDWRRYYPDERFKIPQTGPGQGKEYQSPYDVPSAELQDVIQRRLAPYEVVTLDLSVAGVQEFKIPGQAIVAYGWETSDGFLRTVDTTASLQMFLEDTYPGPDPLVLGAPIRAGFPLKHARGFRGPFSKFTLSWIAQSGVSVDVVIHRFIDLPWIDGESCT